MHFLKIVVLIFSFFRADDSRMLVALGEAYSDLMRYNDAQKCYLRAFKVGDVEGTALMLLGKYFLLNFKYI